MDKNKLLYHLCFICVSYSTCSLDPVIEELATLQDVMDRLENGNEVTVLIAAESKDDNESEAYDEELINETYMTSDATNENTGEEKVAMFLESNRGKTILQYDGHRYRKMYSSKKGVRWTCSTKNNCKAFVYLNNQDEIVWCHDEHNHEPPSRFNVTDNEPQDSAVLLTSRKGKEILLFRNYTYRKQYSKGSKCRWVCSTQKNCPGVVFTDNSNTIISAFEQHCHDPPKYYTNPNNLREAMRTEDSVLSDS